jgi:hypothetical protein
MLVEVLFEVAIYLFFGYCYFLIFKKDSVTPWWGFVPVLDVYGLIKLVGREPIWIVGLFIPCVNFIVIIVLMLDLAKAFGKDVVWGLGLIVLPFIFIPMLAFGSATYVGPMAAKGGAVR